ncbi:UNKNOWN [Stylonychia lemnae]|uniref:Uncharacterized protein n=1 Tax=Stylonychia lemnae TaxID=5949 RepID=A0A078AXB3_STYLE|nr:UNKNOWN [Stylonychia lemnae]|eukprot:CDW86814.1 UNKNOWN [Stylonychia lemnae]
MMIEQREEMIQKYKKRIMQFIDRVAKKPCEKGDDYTRRLDMAEKSFYKSKILGDESIRVQHKYESHRVKEAEEKNKSILDTVPNDILDTGDPLRLREREKDREIVPPYRSQPRGSMERLYDSIIDKGLSNNTRTDKLALKSFHKKIKVHKADPATYMNKTNGTQSLTPRNFLPDLHDKTHFKAAYTIMLNSQSCLQDKYGKTIFVKEQEKFAQNGTNPQQSNNISLSKFNKGISLNHGLHRYSSTNHLQKKGSIDMSLNDRQDLSPRSIGKNDQSIINILNDLSSNNLQAEQIQQYHPIQSQSPGFNLSKIDPLNNNKPNILINTSYMNTSNSRNVNLKKVQSSKIVRYNQTQSQQFKKKDSVDDSALDQLLNAYKSKQEEPDNYLAWEYDKEGQKKPVEVVGLKKKHNFGELLDPAEEERFKSEFQMNQNKTKDMISNCQYVRKKHFKSSTLRYGEGALFMNKGLTNRDYENSIIKKSLQ